MVGVKRTPTSQLLELKLGEDLAEWVAALRADERSWPYIARKLRERTDNEVAFTDDILRRWFTDDEDACESTAEDVAA